MFEAKFLDDSEDTANKSWGATHPHFTRQFNKERRKLERENNHKNYEISAVFRKAPHLHTLDIPHGGLTATKTYRIFTAAIDYITALEEKSNA